MTDAAHQADARDRSSDTMRQADARDRSSDTMRRADARDRSSDTMRQADARDHSSGTMRKNDTGNRAMGNASTIDTDTPTRPGSRPPAGIDTGRQPAAPRRPLAELMAPDWAHALTGVSGQITAMGDFLRAELDAGRGYLPPGPAILRAFAKPMADVRVLIVGQDPYPTPGHAVGLSFSVAPQVRPIPRSLANIYRELCADVGCQPPSTGDLTPWAQRGVMLLNRVLTVRPGQPGSHRGKGWEEVTEAAIRALAARGGPLVAILWGRDAQNLAPMLGPVPRIASAHPSPMSADRGFFGSRPFSRANAALVSQGADPIDWSLP